MLEILAVGLLLIISIFLAFINWRIYKVTLEMLDVTIAIYLRTINLFCIEGFIFFNLLSYIYFL